MGSPKKPKKKYKKPLQVWQSDLIDAQKILTKEYGLKNKKEIWRSEGFLKRLRDQAKHLTALDSEQSAKEKQQLISRIVKLGMIKSDATLENILNLEIKDILERRLQTIVFRKNIAKSVKQSRQFIVHGHISVDGVKMNVPSFLVPLDVETKIVFNPSSKLSSDQHPERVKEASRKEKKQLGDKPDETDIFVGDKSEEAVKKEVTEKIEVKKDVKPKVEAPKKEPIQKVDETTPTEDKTKEEESVTAGKAN
tara:strand:- start:200 stop:952 length:753 start_codon:yes stop_codon:yes gene_type:complete